MRTDQGITGYGEVQGGPQGLICEMAKVLGDLAIGMDAMAHEGVWERLFSATSPRPDGLGGWDGLPAPLPRNARPQVMAAIGGIDIALWDIKGKATALPVYKLLGTHMQDGMVHLPDAPGFGIDIDWQQLARLRA